MPRMKILNSIEQEAFELPPVLNSAERNRHSDFPVAILRITAELQSAEFSKWRTARAQRAMLCPPGIAQRLAESAGRLSRHAVSGNVGKDCHPD